MLVRQLAELSFAGRNPTKDEYTNGSPSERRAIIARWEEIRSKPILQDSDWDEWTKAAARLGWADDLERARPVQFETESSYARWARGDERPGEDNQDDVGL